MLGIAFSCYVFPVEFMILPGINSKMVMAALGLVFLYFDLVNNALKIPRFVVALTLLALLVSLAGFCSILFNQTNDTSYSRYWISYSVWMCAAYFVCRLIDKIHGVVSIRIICNYMIVVCVFQCVSAILIEFIPECKIWVDAIISQNQEQLTAGERLYGIGASLDTAGTRFSIALIMIVYILSVNNTFSNSTVNLYILAYAVIAIIGNMIGRTTLVGVFLSLILLCLMHRNCTGGLNFSKTLPVITVALFSAILMVYLYNTNDGVYELIRFGFEPFFNLTEKGEFATTSNEQLIDMYVWPDTFKTWIVGDGYFNNPNYYDAYYVGKSSLMGYYMGTDVGYLRLIYYFGLVGLVMFVLFLIKATSIPCAYFPKYSMLFIFVFISNMIIWLKVATDLFFMMSLFVCASVFCERGKQDAN